MVLFIKPLTPNKLVYFKENKDSMLIDSVCRLDKNKEYDLYLIDDIINEFGLINHTQVLFDELLITLNVKNVYYLGMNVEELKKYTEYYGVKVYSL